MFRKLFLPACMAAMFFSCSTEEAERTASTDPIKVELTPVGDRTPEFMGIADVYRQFPNLREFFGKDDLRFLGSSALEAVSENKEGTEPASGPQGLRLMLFNMTKNTVHEVSFDVREQTKFTEKKLDYQPNATREELEAAMRAIANRYRAVGQKQSDDLGLFPAMPGAVTTKDGQRAITIGIRGRSGALKPGIYAVHGRDFSEIADISGDYHVAHDGEACEMPPFDCFPDADRRSVNVTVTQGSTVLWQFEALRPAASSGFPTKGSGVELRYVKYKGKMVMFRGHVPILNVHYDQRACGPYRDWQNSETCFKCNGTNHAGTGLRICTSKPLTFPDDHDDKGNFAGVGIYVDGTDVVLVTELEAAWYRYVMEWTLTANGTIKPRFKFGGTANNCTCKLHFHHAYWRFDLDVETAGNNNASSRKKNWYGGWTTANTFAREDKDFRNSPKRWRVENNNGYRCDIRPGANDSDGTGDAWAKGDVFFARYRYSELEDGVSCVGCPGMTGSYQEGAFLNGETIANSDVVVWYRGSFNHQASGPSHAGAEIVGPDIVLGGKY